MIARISRTKLGDYALIRRVIRTELEVEGGGNLGGRTRTVTPEGWQVTTGAIDATTATSINTEFEDERTWRIGGLAIRGGDTTTVVADHVRKWAYWELN